MVTIKQALNNASSLQQHSDSWRLDAELLLAAAIQQQRGYLFTWPDEEISAEQLQLFQQYCARRSKGEPIAYILGRQAFWDFDLMVNPHVLIPRPETELLVEFAIELLPTEQFKKADILDLGTGSGAIALALASTNPNWQLTAVDRSGRALAVARENAQELKLGNIEFRQASWCDGLAPEQFDLIVANPPYVRSGDEHLAQGSLPFEPVMALVAEENGLADIRSIAQQCKYCLKKDAWLLIEHGYDQKDEVAKLLHESAYQNIECIQDLAKLDRMTKAQYPGQAG